MAIKVSSEKVYKSFCKALHDDPELNFSDFCKSMGASSNSVYKWMQRHHMSLKVLYHGVGRSFSASEVEISTLPAAAGPFLPVEVSGGTSPNDSSHRIMRGVCFLFPSGTKVTVDSCAASELAIIIGDLQGNGYV